MVSRGVIAGLVVRRWRTRSHDRLNANRHGWLVQIVKLIFSVAKKNARFSHTTITCNKGRNSCIGLLVFQVDILIFKNQMLLMRYTVYNHLYTVLNSTKHRHTLIHGHTVEWRKMEPHNYI